MAAPKHATMIRTELETMSRPPDTSAWVLVAEDDPEVSRLMVQLLERSGIHAESVSHGLGVAPLLATGKFDLLLLDLMLPGLSGLEVLKNLREQYDIPVIILSALSEGKDRIAGLELGSDDYIVKPFYPREVLLRIQKLLRNKPTQRNETSTRIEAGLLTLDTRQKKTYLDGQMKDLTALEFEVLLLLVRNIGSVVNRKTISQTIYGNDLTASTRRIDMKINHLRKLLGPHSQMIRTVWGVGYEFIPMEKP